MHNSLPKKSEANKELTKWASDYFQSNEAVLLLFGIKNPDELAARIIFYGQKNI